MFWCLEASVLIRPLDLHLGKLELNGMFIFLTLSTLAGIHRHPEQFWKGSSCRVLSCIQKNTDMKLHVCYLSIVVWDFCGYVVTFRFILLVLYTPFFWAYLSF